MTLLGSGSAALGVVIGLSIVVPLVALAVVCWAFWRSARRFDAEQEEHARRVRPW